MMTSSQKQITPKTKIPFFNIKRIFNYFFLFFFCFLFISVVTKNNSSTFSYKMLPSLFSFMLILFLVIFIPILSLKFPKIKSYLSKKYIDIIFISMIVLMLVQMIIIYYCSTKVGWDVGILISGATSENLNDGTYFYSYFSTYPNNLFLLFIFRAFSSIFGSDGLFFKLNIISLIALDISILLVFCTVKKISNLKNAYLSFYLSILTFGIFPWLIVPYSDTLSMPFTIGTYFLFLKYLDISKSDKKLLKYLYPAIIGLFIYIGYLIKPTTVIVAIGIIVCTIIYKSHDIIKHYSTKALLNTIIPIFLLITTIFASNIIWKQYIYNQNTITLNKDLNMPMSHFFMLGLSETNGMYGTWNTEDVNLSLSYFTKSEKIEANKKVIKERLNNYGILGYTDFLLSKARWITSEGNFFFGGEGNFANFDLEKNPNLLKNIIYSNGKYNSSYQYFLQGIWITILFLIIISSVIFNENNDFHYFSFSMIIFGIILFILLFEGRSRYLILYLPFFVMYAARGLNYILNKLSHIKRREP